MIQLSKEKFNNLLYKVVRRQHSNATSISHSYASRRWRKKRCGPKNNTSTVAIWAQFVEYLCSMVLRNTCLAIE